MAKPTVKLNKAKSTDGNGLEDHFKGLNKAKKHVTIGIQQDAHDYSDGTSVLMVAQIGEYGNAANNIPPRHFLSRSVEMDKSWYTSKIKKVLKAYDKKSKFITTAFNEMGRKGVARVQSYIEQNNIGMTSNKPSTIAAKGGNQPMVDTGHLVRQIDYKQEGGKL